MITVTNKLDKTTPVAETTLQQFIKETLEVPTDQLQQGIESFLTKLTALPEAANYKFIVSVTSTGSTTQGPLQTFAGAHWDDQHDGTWVHKLDGASPRIVVLTWIKT